MKKRNDNSSGALGEKLAAEYLKKKGYLIHTMNYRSRFGEIDIVAEKDDTVVFVEVKTRAKTAFGNPSEYVTESKQQKISATAEYYVYMNDITSALRFDVIEIVTGKVGDMTNASINHIENAFEKR